jgi:hypothetical protein
MTKQGRIDLWVWILALFALGLGGVVGEIVGQMPDQSIEDLRHIFYA